MDKPRTSNYRFVIKMLSVLVSGIFFFEQLVWAGGGITPAGDTDDPVKQPEALDTWSVMAQSSVDNKNAIEEFNNLPVKASDNPVSPHDMEYDSRETVDGVTYYYFDDILQEKVYEDGRAYVYREYTASGAIKVFEYYSSGGAYSYTQTDFYDSEDVYLGKRIEYASGMMYEYDQNGRTTKVKYSNGYCWQYEYYEDGKYKVREYLKPDGTLYYRYEYFYEGDVYKGYSMKYSSGTEYTYNEDNKLIKSVYSNGYYYIYEYYGDGNTRSRTYYKPDDSMYYRYDYYYEDGVYLGYSRKYSSGTEYHYNADNKLTKSVYSNGYYRIYEYYDTGENKSQTYYKPDGTLYYRYDYYYDDNGVYQGYSRVYSNGTEYHYNADNKPTKVVYSNGYYRTYEYYPSGESKSNVYYKPDGSLYYRYDYYRDDNGDYLGYSIKYASGTEYHYNADNRIIKSVYSSGYYRIYEYYDDGANKTQEYYKPDGSLYYRYDYYYDDDGVYLGYSRKYYNGTEYHYNADGKPTKTVYSSGYYYIYDYYENGETKTRAYYKSDGSLYYEYSYNYDSEWNYTGRVVLYGDGRAYYYGSDNRCYKRVNSNGTYYLYEYYPNGRTKTYSYYYADDSLYYRYTYLYDDTGTTYLGRIIAYGDGREYHYDADYRLTKRVYSDGSLEIWEYWSSSGQAKKKYSKYGSADIWLETIEYYEDGYKAHYHTMADPDTSNDGDVVYIEYDEQGHILSKKYDNDIEEEFYLSGRMKIRTMANNDVYEYADENWNGHAYGRLLKYTRFDGFYTIYEDYFAGTDQARYNKRFMSSGTAINDLEYDINGYKISEYSYFTKIYKEYHVPSGRIKLEDIPGEAKYEYLDEDWQNTSKGRLAKKTLVDGACTIFEGYFAGIDQAEYITNYNSSGDVIDKKRYDEEGEVIEDFIYENGYLVTKKIYDNSLWRNELYTMYQISDGQIFSQRAITYGLVGDKAVSIYHCDPTNPGSYAYYETDERGNIIAEYWYAYYELSWYQVKSYDQDNKLLTIDVYYRDQDSGEFMLSFYTVVNYDVNGRLAGYDNYNADGVKTNWQINEYNADDQLGRVVFYSEGSYNGETQYSYNSDGTIDTETSFDPGGVKNSEKTYEYSEGVLFKSTIFWYFDWGNISKNVNLYDAYGNLYREEHYYNDVMESYVEYENTNLKETYNYYAQSGRVKTLQILNGKIYEYSDEDWNATGAGRLIKETEADGAYKLYEDYYPGTDQARYIKVYDRDDNLIVTWEYDTDGNLISKTDGVTGIATTYYVPSGNVQTENIPGDAIYEYMNENWQDTGKGRVVKKTLTDGTYTTYEGYFYGVDQSEYMRRYDVNGVVLWEEKYDVEGRLLEKLIYEDGVLVTREICNSSLWRLEASTAYQVGETQGTSRNIILYEFINGRAVEKYEYDPDCPDNYTVYECDERGNITSSHLYYNGALSSYTIRTYNDNDQITSYESYFEDYVQGGEIRLFYRTVMNYDDDGRYMGYDQYDGDGNKTGWSINEYNEQSQWVRLTKYWQGEYNGEAIFTYTNEGLIKTEIYYDKDGNKDNEDIYEYADGVLSKRTHYWYGSSGGITKTIYFHDKYGNESGYESYLNDELSNYGVYENSSSLETYNYFPQSGRIKTLQILNGKIYEYSDEDWNSTGQGQLIRETEIDGSYKLYEDYYPGTGQARYIKEYDRDDNLLVTYEYDSDGNLISKTDETTGIMTTYYTPSSNIKTENIPDDGLYEYMDENWQDTGKGRVKKKTLTDGSYTVYEDYYDGTAQARYIKEYDPEDNLIEETEYDEDGNVVVPFDEILGDYGIKREDNGSVSTYIFDPDGKAYKNTYYDAENGVFEIYKWDIDWSLVSVVKKYDDGTEDIYEALDEKGVNLRLLEKRISEESLIKGVNLPWVNYGYDLGEVPGSDHHIGFSTTRDQLFSQFDLWKGSYARVFLFSDLRSSVEFDGDGNPLRFTDKVFEDMRALLEVAKMFNVKLIPVLFDYGIADGVEIEDIYEVGEHADLINDIVKRKELLDIFDSFFDEFADDPAVYAWDVINEPEYASSVSMNKMKSFVNDFVDLIHSKSTEIKATVGSRNINDMLQFWVGTGLDIYQYHYYDKMESDDPLGTSIYDLELDKPVLVGELEPTDCSGKLAAVDSCGYLGGLFWQDTDRYQISASQKVDILDHFSGRTVTYEYYDSGRLRHEIYSDLTVREFEDLDFYGDGKGRLVRSTNANGDYSVFEYYEGTDTVEKVTFYCDNSNPVCLKEYEVSGDLLSVRLYDPMVASQLRSVLNSDGTYTLYDEYGQVKEAAVEDNGDINVYDKDGGLIRTIEADGKVYVYDPAISAVQPIRELRSDGTSCEYFMDDSGVLSGYYEYTIDKTVNIYDADGVLVEAISIQDEAEDAQKGIDITTDTGDVLTYVDGEIVSVKFDDTGDILTNMTFDDEGGLLKGLLKRTDGSVCLIYDGKIVSAYYKDGTMSLWRDGVLTAKHSGGLGWIETYYDYNDSEELVAVHTYSGGDHCFYDGSGNASEFIKSDGEWTYYHEGHLRHVIDAGNTQLSYEYNDDADGKKAILVSGIITSYNIPKIITYSDSDDKKVETMELYDGTKINYEDGALGSVVGATERIISLDTGELGFYNGKYEKYYDEDGNICKLVDENNTTIYFSDGEITEVEAESGSRLLYTGGNITDLFDEEEGAHYETDPDTGMITKVSYDDGRVYLYAYEGDVSSELKVTITNVDDEDDVTVRYYEGDCLVRQELPSGIISVYTYEDDPDTSGVKRIASINQSKNGEDIGSYQYEYLVGKTLVTDIDGTIREYDDEGQIAFLYTADGYTYKYTYTDIGTLVMELVQQEHSDGRIVYYKSGEVVRVESPDGTVLKDPVFDKDGMLESFTVISPENVSRRVRVYADDWSTITAADGTKLIFKGNVLIALNLSGRLFMYQADEKVPSEIPLDISDDPTAIYNIEGVEGSLTDYEIYKLYSEYNISETPLVTYNIINGGNTAWHAETNSSTLGITSASVSGDVVALDADMVGGSVSSTAGKCQGEAFIDLRYPYSGNERSATYDFDGQRLSYYIKLEDGALAEGDKVDFRIVLKNDNNNSWAAEYSPAITVTQDGIWYELSLDISDVAPDGGYFNGNFDPSLIRLVGIRAECYYPGMSYDGKIYVKNANQSTIPAGESLVEMPFLVNKASVEPFVGVIPDDQPLGDNPGYIGWQDIPTIWDGEEEQTDNGVIDLDISSWRVQTYMDSLGVTGIERDDAGDQWVLTLDMEAGGDKTNQGEVFVDMRYDVPDYDWTGPVDLSGKTLTFKVKAPEDFPVSDDKPLWAQLFVKDVNNNHQYGIYTLINKVGEWLEVTLTPQFGEIEEGVSETSVDFDPTQCVHIGLKISYNDDSEGAYQGDFYVRNETSPDILNETTPIYLIDANALKKYAVDNNIVITYEEYLGEQIGLARTALPSYFKDSSYTMATEYYPWGGVKSVLKGNRRIENYDADEKLVSITDLDGEELVTYKYGPDGDLVEVDYSGIREDIADSMQEMRDDLMAEAEKTIVDMAEAKEYAHAYVDEIIKPGLDQCNRTESELRRMWHEWDQKELDAWDRSGKEEKKQNMHAIEDAIRKVSAKRRQLYSQAAALYADIDADIASAKADVEAQLNENLENINNEEEKSILRTLEQEMTEVLDVYYKKYLGRNETDAEKEEWFDVARQEGCLDIENRIAFDVQLVIDKLETDEDYIAEKEANDSFINDIIEGIESELDTLSGLSDTERIAFATQLGIQEDEIQYDVRDFEAILSWLGSNNKHFGKSAFFSLLEMLPEGSNIDLKDLAVKTILIDILTGSITSITTGDLAISMYSLKTYAALQGETFHALQLDNSSITSLAYVIQSGAKAIIRIEGNHFVVVTGIDLDSGMVTYYEPSQGKSGSVRTIDIGDMLKVWDGYVVSERGPPEDGISRELSNEEAMQIRGSDPFMVFLVISIISAIISTTLSFIDNEICQLLSKIFAIVSLVTGVLNIAVNFSNIISSFATGVSEISKGLATATTDLGAMFVEGVKGFVNGLPALIGRAVIGISLNTAYTNALVTFGVNANIAGLTGAFLSGGFMDAGNALMTGGLQAGASFGMANAVTSLVIQGTRYAGYSLGIDSSLTNIIGLAAGTIVNAGIGGVMIPDVGYKTGFEAVSYAIGHQVFSNVVSELAFYGITELGEFIGLDERISYLAGIAIRSSLRMGFGTGGGDPGEWLDGAIDGIAQGVTSIGLNYLVDEFDLNPLLANIGFSAISTAINGTLQAMLPGNENLNVFKFMFETYEKNALAFMGGGLDPRDPKYSWQQAAYIAQIQDFSNIISERGIVEALNSYATGFFNSTAVNSIVSAGFTLGEYFKTKYDAGTIEEITLDDGTKVDGVRAENTESILLFDSEGNIIGLKEGEKLLFGEIGVDSVGKMALLNGYIKGNYVPGLGITMDIENGYQTNARIIDPVTGDTLYWVRPAGDGNQLYFDSYEGYINYQIDDILNNEYDISYDINSISSSFDIIYDAGFSSGDYQLLSEKLGLKVEDIQNMVLRVQFDGEKISLIADLPEGCSVNVNDDPFAISLIFGDLGEVVTGQKVGTNENLSSFSQNFRKIFSMCKSMPTSLFSWYNQQNIFTDIFNYASGLSGGQTAKEVVGAICDILEHQYGVFDENISEEERMNRFNNILGTIDSLPDTLCADSGFDAGSIEEGLELFENSSLEVFKIARGTQAYKDIIKEMEPRDRLIHDLLWLWVENREDIFDE